MRSQELRLRVERLRARCHRRLADGLTPCDVLQEIRLLEGLCIESWSGFLPWIETARAALLEEARTRR